MPPFSGFSAALGETRTSVACVCEVVKALGPEDSSQGFGVAMVIDSEPSSNDADEELGVEEAKRFKSIAALANYVDWDRSLSKWARLFCAGTWRGPRVRAGRG